MRAVLDANVLVSAFVYPQGRVASVWRAALAQRYTLVTSPEIVTELAAVLRRTFGWDDPRINRQLKRIIRFLIDDYPFVSVPLALRRAQGERKMLCPRRNPFVLSLSKEEHECTTINWKPYHTPR